MKPESVSLQSRRPGALRPELLGLGLLAVASAVFLAESWRTEAQLDDAYIYYRYARNLVEGLGLVYNPGEYVEGNTSFLWTLLIAAGVRLGFEATAVGHALGLGGGLAVLIATYVYARTALPAGRVWLAALPALVVVSSVAFPRWMISGMDSPVFVSLVTATLASHARGRMGWATGFVTLATLTRPEGVILATILFAFHLISAWRDRVGPARSWAVRASRLPLVYALAVVLLTLFRTVYYGSALPNTFYAKASGVPMYIGVLYFESFLRDGAWLLIPAALVALREPRWWLGVAWTVAASFYVVLIGGDAFGHSRFLLPVLPCLAVLCLRGSEIAYRAQRHVGAVLASTLPVAILWHFIGEIPAAIWLCASLLLVAWLVSLTLERGWPLASVAAALTVAAAVYAATVQPSVAAWTERFGDLKHVRNLREARAIDRYFLGQQLRKARILEDRGEKNALVAASGIGVFGYYSRLPIVDMLGLVDETIARSAPSHERHGVAIPGHDRSDAGYVLSREPDYIFAPRKGGKVGFEILVGAVRELLQHPDLERYYTWDEHLGAYQRVKRSESPK